MSTDDGAGESGPDRPLRRRVVGQFSGTDDRAAIWRGFERFLPTREYLNLGYSPWYLPHFAGTSQRRLAGYVGAQIAAELPATDGVRLLDVGCGRGGPALHLADRFGFDVTGVDLVPYNVASARENARDHGLDAEFVVGDATALPLAVDSMMACTAIDALVYVPERGAAITEIASVLERNGVLVCSDLVCQAGLDEEARAAVSRFADAWDMPPLASLPEYRQLFLDSSLRLEAVESITANSVGRFRRWTTLFLELFDSPLRPLGVRLLRRMGLRAAAVRDQIAAAHRALPHLEHVVFVARNVEPPFASD